MSIAEEGRLVAPCGICRKRRSLTTFRAVANGERVCGGCWLEAMKIHIDQVARAMVTRAALDGEPVTNVGYAFRLAAAAPGYGAT